ncbi:hypothetical protein B296_00048088 [Ensete ventricosum]|uniref:Uncharacterized protein n=1 Tax=Ensete ventricosum TaxID=4639 RepID=A0A426XE29_ENSVE|nr:hypothetical protein B296_00048088 [Ensete ventricosum]
MPLLPPLSSLLFATQPHPRCLPLLPLPGDTILLIGSLPPLLSSTSVVAANPTSTTPVACHSSRPSLISLLYPSLPFLILCLCTFLARLTVALFFLCELHPHPSSVGAAIFFYFSPPSVTYSSLHCHRPPLPQTLLLSPFPTAPTTPCFLLCHCYRCHHMPPIAPPSSVILGRSIVVNNSIAIAASHSNA